LQVSGRRAVQVEQGAFRVSVQARKISCVRVVGAGLNQAKSAVHGQPHFRGVLVFLPVVFPPANGA